MKKFFFLFLAILGVSAAFNVIGQMMVGQGNDLYINSNGSGETDVDNDHD